MGVHSSEWVCIARVRVRIVRVRVCIARAKVCTPNARVGALIQSRDWDRIWVEIEEWRMAWAVGSGHPPVLGSGLGLERTPMLGPG